MHLSLPQASHRSPFASRDPLFIEFLVFAVAQSAVYFSDSSDRTPAQKVAASILILGFSILGVRELRMAFFNAFAKASLDFGILIALALLHAPASALIFIIVASAFRNGIVLSGPVWLAFVCADIVLLFSVLFFFTHHHEQGYTPGRLLERASYAGVALGLVLAAIRYANSARTALDALSVAYEELGRHVDRVGEIAALQERERIALDIHDALGHGLTSLTMQIEVARCLIAANEPLAETHLSQAHALSLEILADVRRSVREIASDPLERGPLDVVLRRVCDRFELASGIELSLSVDQLPPISAATVTHAVNIVREALTNIARHAAAHHIRVSVIAATSAITVVVQDDGRGFAPDDNGSGHGLRSMRSRARAMNAKLDIKSRPGAGSEVCFSFAALGRAVTS